MDSLLRAIGAQDTRFAALAGKVTALEEALEHVIEQEATVFRRRLGRRYELLNPARETIALDEDHALVREDGEATVDQLRGMTAYLLDKANYERLSDEQVEATIGMASSHGMQIELDPSKIRCLELYVRGRSTGEQWSRTWRHPWQGETRTVEQFRRLAVVFQLEGSPHLNLKLFRDIPIADLESLLPHAEVKMSSWDRMKIAGGALGALGGLATKLWSYLVHDAAVGTQFTYAVILAMLGLSVRSFFGYRAARKHRASQMTHHLYYQNVANNAGVVNQLLGAIAQEELKEALLAYALLQADPQPRSADDLKRAVEDWLRSTFDVEVHFDAADAIETLDRFTLWSDREAWTPLNVEEAIATLDQHWQGRASRSYHLDAWRSRYK